MSTQTTTCPRVIGFDDDLDLLAEYPTADVAGRNLREGMVLVDEFNTPAALLSTKQRTVRNSGCVFFLTYNYDQGRYVDTSLHANQMFRVIAR